MDHPVTVRVRAFHQKHGPESYSDGSSIYYANGSWREVNPLGLLADCENFNMNDPEQEWIIRTNQLTFAKLKLAKAVEEFDELNTRLQHTTPNDPDEELKQLKRLQTLVEERKGPVAAAQRAFDETKWGLARAARRKNEEEAHQRFAEFQRQRSLIRI